MRAIVGGINRGGSRSYDQLRVSKFYMQLLQDYGFSVFEGAWGVVANLTVGIDLAKTSYERVEYCESSKAHVSLTAQKIQVTYDSIRKKSVIDFSRGCALVIGIA